MDQLSSQCTTTVLGGKVKEHEILPSAVHVSDNIDVVEHSSPLYPAVFQSVLCWLSISSSLGRVVWAPTTVSWKLDLLNKIIFSSPSARNMKGTLQLTRNAFPPIGKLWTEVSFDWASLSG